MYDEGMMENRMERAWNLEKRLGLIVLGVYRDLSGTIICKLWQPPATSPQVLLCMGTGPKIT